MCKLNKMLFFSTILLLVVFSLNNIPVVNVKATRNNAYKNNNYISTLKTNNQKTVYLTFDDGPSTRVTPVILDILKEENIKATFFLIGVECEIRPQIVERMDREGHKIGVHSYSHKYKEIYKNEKALIDDINKCDDVIKKILPNWNNKIYRFPGGSSGRAKKYIETVQNLGYNYYDWNASCLDAEINNPTSYQLYKAVVKTTGQKDNVILLMHDYSSKITTAKALKAIIKFYRDNNYVFSALTK